MEQINRFNEKIDEIEKIDNLDIKSQTVKDIKEELKIEKERVEEMIDKISNIKPKRNKKLKGLTLEKLKTMFENEDSLTDKLLIYQQICYLIELTKNKLFEPA